MKKKPDRRPELNFAFVSLKLNDQLYARLAKESDTRGLPLIETVVQILAEKFDRPDLAYVPRKRSGRPRTKALAEH